MEYKMDAETKKFLEELLAKYDGALTAEGQEDMLAKFGANFADEMTKKWEEKIGALEAIKGDVTKGANGFEGLGDFTMAVKNFTVDVNANRLKTLQTDTLGEYIIPPAYASEIMRTAFESNPFMSLATKIPLKGNSLSIPYLKDKNHTSGNLFGGVVLYWAEEGTSVTASDIKAGKINLRLHDLMGIIPVTNDMLEDAPQAIDVLVKNVFGDALGSVLEDAFINGNGVGKPLGVFQSSAKVSQAKKTSQTAATIVSENLTGMLSHLPKASKSRAIWIYGSSTYTEIINCKIGSSDFPAFMPAGAFRNAQSLDTILGRPAFESEHITAGLGSVGDILLVDPTQYVVATKGGFEGKFDSSLHLYFDTNRTAYRIVFRVDGQPTWDTYITPAQGTHYKSPIITLAERT